MPMRILFIYLLLLSLLSCSTSVEKQEKALLYLQLGNNHISNGNYPFALRDLLTAEDLDPKNPVIQNSLGQVYFLRERYDLSQKHFNRALELDEKFTDAKNNLSRVLIEIGKYEDAEKLLEAVLQDLTYANLEKAYINYGLLFFNQKKFERAKAQFIKALDAQSDSCIASNYLGRTIFEIKDYPGASRALDRAIGFCQKSMIDEPHFYSALSYYRSGNKAKAEIRFSEIIQLYPNGKYKEKAQSMLELVRKGIE